MRRILSEVKVARDVLRKEGPRALFRKYGWKLVIVIFAYYLIRDVTLYILIPMFIYKSVTS